MEENLENLDSPNQEDIITPKVDTTELGLPADPVEVEPQDEEVADVEELKTRNQELYEQLKKAKGFVRGKDGKWMKKEQPKPQPIEKDGMAGITTEELYSLVKANVPDEDTSEVKLYARSHGITITEALKTQEVKALLGVKSELRKTADTANTGSGRRSSSKVSDDTLLDNVRKGILPQSDDDIKRLVKMSIGKKN